MVPEFVEKLTFGNYIMYIIVILKISIPREEYVQLLSQISTWFGKILPDYWKVLLPSVGNTT